MCCTQIRHHSHWGADIHALLALSLSKNVSTHPIAACMCPVHGMDWARPPSFGSCARAKLRQRPPTAHAPVAPLTGSTSSTAKQAAPGRILSTEVALSPTRKRSVASDPTCTRNTSGSLRSRRCAKRAPPQSQSVRAGVQRCVLEQGECSRSCGQQLIVRGMHREHFVEPK